jgi:hypothetical protein
MPPPYTASQDDATYCASIANAGPAATLVSCESGARIRDENGAYAPADAPIRRLPGSPAPVCALAAVAKIRTHADPKARRVAAIMRSIIRFRLIAIIIS